MRFFRLLFFASVFAFTLSCSAHDLTLERSSGAVSLIELYSSDGCSSCPPAEEWLGRWKDSAQLWHQVFPVAFHVDYWDGLGWPDRFARPAYTDRQRSYAAKLQQDSVYTPEFVINGREWRGWFHGDVTPPTIETAGDLVLTIGAQGGSLSADYKPVAATAATSYTLHTAWLGLGLASDIRSGENAGRHLQHDFIVLSFHATAMTANSGHFLAGPVGSDTGSDQPQAVVAWVSTPEMEVVQVVGGWLR